MRGRHPHRGLPPRRRRSSSSTVREWRRRWANGTWPPPASSMTTWLPSGPRAPRRRRRSHPSTTQRDRGLRVLEEARQECAPKTDAFALGVRLQPLHGLDLAVGLPSCAHTDHALVPLDGRGLVAEALEIRAVHAGDVLLHEGAVGRGVAGVVERHRHRCRQVRFRQSASHEAVRKRGERLRPALRAHHEEVLVRESCHRRLLPCAPVTSRAAGAGPSVSACLRCRAAASRGPVRVPAYGAWDRHR